MDFDKTVSQIIDGYELKYGALHGNENIFFIKCGAGGSIPGYDEKYLKIAHRLHDRLGATVICSAYPYPSEEYLLEYDVDLINKFISKFNFKAKLNFIGSSRGAYVGLTYFSKRFDFSNMLLVNMPLMINFHKSIEALSEISQKRVIFVYGEHDPSASYIPYLRLHHGEILTVSGADHTFTDMTDDFIALSDLI
jgi:pimeloyl-ACP methyl ester carboxylesterase